MIYTFPARITDVFERKLTKHVSGAGPGTVFSSDSGGWYIQIDYLHSIYIGMEQPSLVKGQKISIQIKGE